jgi:hypothetical protein
MYAPQACGFRTYLAGPGRQELRLGIVIHSKGGTGADGGGNPSSECIMTRRWVVARNWEKRESEASDEAESAATATMVCDAGWLLEKRGLKTIHQIKTTHKKKKKKRPAHSFVDFMCDYCE